MNQQSMNSEKMCNEHVSKESIIAAFQQQQINVEIVENKNGQLVVSRMCELYQRQVFEQEQQWNDTIEKAIKDKIQLLVKPELRKMIAREQAVGKAIKPILTLAGPLPTRNAFTFDLVFMMRLETMTTETLTDTIQLLQKIDGFISSIAPNAACA